MFDLGQNYLTIMIVLAYLLSFLIGPSVVEFCRKNIKLDATEKRQHTTPTPSSGGVGFVIISILFMIPIIFIEYSSLNVSFFLLVMVLCSIIVAVLGFLDDKHDLSAKRRLFWQSLAVLMPLSVLPDVWPGIPEFIEKPVLFLGWMWFVNLYNFIDGIDGYSSMQAIFICLMASMIAPLFTPLFAIVGASVAGFLRVNAPLPKAKIFMGDGASTFLGFTLGGLMFAGLTLDGSYAFSFATITLLFVIDASQTIIKRFIRGQKPLMLGHQEHWFARMYALKFSHRKILLLGLCVNIALGTLVYFTYDNNWRFVSPFIGCLIFTVLALYVKNCEKKAGIKVPGFNKKDRY